MYVFLKGLWISWCQYRNTWRWPIMCFLCVCVCGDCEFLSWVEFYVTTDGQPASLSWYKAPIWGLRPDLYYLYDNYGLALVGRPFWREDGLDFYICCWPLPAQSFFGPSPLGLATIFYCLTFETSLFVASYDSQGHGGGIRSRLHTGISLCFSSPHYIAFCRTTQKTRSPTVLLLLRVYSLPMNGSLVWWVNNLFTVPLPRNGRRLSLSYRSCHNMMSYYAWSDLIYIFFVCPVSFLYKLPID
jgi:hypothetical protein